MHRGFHTSVVKWILVLVLVFVGTTGADYGRSDVTGPVRSHQPGVPGIRSRHGPFGPGALVRRLICRRLGEGSRGARDLARCRGLLPLGGRETVADRGRMLAACRSGDLTKYGDIWEWTATEVGAEGDSFKALCGPSGECDCSHRYPAPLAERGEGFPVRREPIASGVPVGAPGCGRRRWPGHGRV